MLQYSRVGRVKEKQTLVDLQILVQDVIDAIAPKGIKIEIDTELPKLFADKTRMHQLFQNLISNAIKYTDKPEGEIHVGHSETNGFWEFYVSDTGIGIEERHFDRIFQIFQTLVPSDQSESTGVGLAIAKKIVEMYGGKIWVKSEINRGSTFYFTIPVIARMCEDQTE